MTSKNKGADQLHCYHTVDLWLCFRIYAKGRFSHDQTPMLLGQSRTMFVYCSSEDSIMGGIEESPEERHAHAPPPSLVPRLHAVLANHLTHINPYMPGYKEEAYKEGIAVKIYNVRTDNIIIYDQF